MLLQMRTRRCRLCLGAAEVDNDADYESAPNPADCCMERSPSHSHSDLASHAAADELASRKDHGPKLAHAQRLQLEPSCGMFIRRRRTTTTSNNTTRGPTATATTTTSRKLNYLSPDATRLRLRATQLELELELKLALALALALKLKLILLSLARAADHKQNTSTNRRLTSAER